METNDYKKNLLTRFLHYVSFDTQSKPSAKHSPSSVGQMKLAQNLQKELTELGLQNVQVSKHAVVTAYLPANCAELRRNVAVKTCGRKSLKIIVAAILRWGAARSLSVRHITRLCIN